MRPRLCALLHWLWIHKLLTALICLFGAAVLLWGVHETSRPLFCRSCHEMGYSYRTWQRSSHRDVPCQDCHYQAGLLGMVRTKLQGAREVAVHIAQEPTEAEILPGSGYVPPERCYRCHPAEKLPPEQRYHLLIHTHAKHLQRTTECRICHANVVHGGKAPFKNTPTMTSCMRCHDGKQAPNRCGLCHEKLGEIRPALYNPAWVVQHREKLKVTGSDRCKSCHGEHFCQSCHLVTRPPSHTGDWIKGHQTIRPAERQQCKQCHEPRGDLPEADFCVDCHTARRAHGRDFLTRHPREFQKEPEACVRCHEQNFCANCHAIYMPHESNWLVNHGPASRKKRDSCRTCHNDAFCTACHTQGRPPSHGAEWYTSHANAAKRAPDGCRLCHTTNFCQQCHRKARPANHKDAMWITAHGGVALANRSSCRACHDNSYCTDCHRGVAMPHPTGWLHSHPQSRMATASCRTCHPEVFCETCHRGNMPTSHTIKWSQTHGATARKSKNACLKCHGERYCDTCHRIPMPHPRNIATRHSDLARGKEGRLCGLCHASDTCRRCHQKRPPSSHKQADWLRRHGKIESFETRCILCHSANECRDCHKVEMPHPKGWVLELHGCIVQTNPETCIQCHPSNHCQSCHESTPPSSHAVADFRKNHDKQENNEPLCAACHGRDVDKKWNACQTCHQGLEMPHPKRYTLEHKSEGSFAVDGTCLVCHELKDCRVCHTVISDR